MKGVTLAIDVRQRCPLGYGLPPLGFGGSFGNSGSMASHNSPLASSFAMPTSEKHQVQKDRTAVRLRVGWGPDSM
jgi:hypothetical protein